MMFRVFFAFWDTRYHKVQMIFTRLEYSLNQKKSEAE